MDRPRIPCKWCGTPTRMLGTRMCDGCWELDHRIRQNTALAERILKHYKEQEHASKILNKT